ncbi:hypothetical protein MSG28_002903 [Choristoneura fumiferana]|uniref:Uncharacterized protein n=1 Tax=Choristoneura fumiferana TaxID=7141 RepID=A0ACC0JJQ8_CHOFU|nr:hypothetical protein MSG28_002903 [Choristoneura fumiferana]
MDRVARAKFILGLVNKNYGIEKIGLPKLVRNTSKDQEGKPIKWLKIKCLRFEKVLLSSAIRRPLRPIRLIPGKKAIPRPRKRLKVQRGTRTDECKISDQRQTWLDQFKAFPIPKAYLTPLPNSEAKKKDLTGLCVKGIILQDLHYWYESLPTQKDIIDTLPEPDITEEDPEVL